MSTVSPPGALLLWVKGVSVTVILPHNPDPQGGCYASTLTVPRLGLLPRASPHRPVPKHQQFTDTDYS